jgi:chromosome partitioning protein
MLQRALTFRVVVALSVCAPFGIGGEAASAQGGNRDRGVQPPTELLREYPFRQGRLRSRERSQRDPARADGLPRSAQAPGQDPSGDTGGSGWIVITAVLGAALLLVLGLAARRVARANRGPRGPQAPAPFLAGAAPLPAGSRRPRSPPPPTDRRAGSYAVVNQKGGVGKTTISLTVGVAAARRGTRVLVVDLDPQASATMVLAPGVTDRQTVADAILKPASCPLGATVIPTEWGVDLVPSERALRSAETQRPAGEEGVLARQLDTVGEYDLLLIDCPPNLGGLAIEALNAVSRALVVTEPTYLALQAIDELVDTMRDVASERNPSLALGGVVLNRVENTAEHRRGLAEVEEVFGSRVLEPHIPKRAVLQDAMRQGVPPQDLPSHYADEIADLFDALAEHLEAVPAKRFAPGTR